jgi:predicted membrane protein
MEDKASRRPTPQLVFGIIVIIVGVLITLDNLNILAAGELFRWWPLALMALGLVQLFESESAGRRMAGALLLGIGSLFLLDRMHVLHFVFRELWPLILVMIGIVILWGAWTRERGPSDGGTTVNATAILGGVERTCTSQDFRGGEITAVMGGCEIDLRQALIKADEAVIHAFAFWGGIEIQVPETWTVTLTGFPFMGGMTDSSRAPMEHSNQRLLIKGFVIMGGIEIRN